MSKNNVFWIFSVFYRPRAHVDRFRENRILRIAEMYFQNMWKKTWILGEKWTKSKYSKNDEKGHCMSPIYYFLHFSMYFYLNHAIILPKSGEIDQIITFFYVLEKQTLIPKMMISTRVILEPFFKLCTFPTQFFFLCCHRATLSCDSVCSHG